MPLNLIESVKAVIPPDFISKASSYLGENTDNISKAITGAVPAAVTGIISRVESGDISGVLNSAKEALNNNVLENASAIFSGGNLTSTTGNDFVNNLFGAQTNNVVNALAAHSGIKTSSANSILSMIVPLVLGVLGKHAVNNNLATDGLSAFLSEQKSGVLSMLPASLNISNWIGSAKKAISTTVDEVRSVAEKPKRNWLMPVILIILLIVLIIYLLKSCNSANEATATSTPDTTAVVPAPAPDTTAMIPARESLKVKLADGTEIEAYKGGIEDMLVNCLNDATCKAGKDKWFDFDNLNFETGSANITPESQVQVNNIAAILKAYPKVKIKIGGYTDKTGNEEDNKKLSQARADSVLNAIKAAGANATQLAGAEGYGSQFATVPATASDEDRKKDRRISVQLREK
jgi:outer membrane protein OmpA-like peptidoglycan-associated protein